MPSPDKNKPNTITGSRFVGGNYTRHEQRELTCSAVQYGRQKYGLFCKKTSSCFVRNELVSEAELGEGTVPLCKPTKKQGVLRWFLMWRWLYGPNETTLLELTDI